MKKYILKLTTFVSIFSILYLLFFYFVDQGLQKSQYKKFAQWNDIYQGKINADILIHGSSRAWRHADPKIIDSISGFNSYNLGINAYQIPMQITRYNIYRKYNSKPRCIIQILDHFSITRRDDLFDKEQFLPYLYDTILTNETKKYLGLNWADYSIPYFRYIGSQENAFVGFLEYFNLMNSKTTSFKGFEPIGVKGYNWQPEWEAEKVKNPLGKRANISQEVFDEFDTFLANAKKENVEVVLVYAPEYFEFQDYLVNRDTICYLYQKLATKHEISFIDYSSDSLCLQKDYFYNPNHLNIEGSRLFSLNLAKRIKHIMQLN